MGMSFVVIKTRTQEPATGTGYQGMSSPSRWDKHLPVSEEKPVRQERLAVTRKRKMRVMFECPVKGSSEKEIRAQTSYGSGLIVMKMDPPHQRQASGMFCQAHHYPAMEQCQAQHFLTALTRPGFLQINQRKHWVPMRDVRRRRRWKRTGRTRRTALTRSTFPLYV
ncbi:hypothetical protein AAFF_G00272400 [Aldrovandia affinis]|uniref:Uncharacterized protein n=1 Tax=Aldrovandia affinis TaxID=143900 RepID=A0AAD7RAN7_9TELE|nr:hypothetical protein AAFF_G00272400 [Aldrovandia affinis]